MAAHWTDDPCDDFLAMLDAIRRAPVPSVPMVGDIQRAVATSFSIDPAEMKSQCRAREVARPRQVAMYLARRLTPRSLPEIGRLFGKRDHSTVVHAIKTIDRLRSTDADFDRRVRGLIRQFDAVAA